MTVSIRNRIIGYTYCSFAAVLICEINVIEMRNWCDRKGVILSEGSAAGRGDAEPVVADGPALDGSDRDGGDQGMPGVCLKISVQAYGLHALAQSTIAFSDKLRVERASVCFLQRDGSESVPSRLIPFPFLPERGYRS